MNPPNMEFRLAPELRRACWWALGGMAALVASAALLRVLVPPVPGFPPPRPFFTIEGVLIVAGFCTAITLPLWWRVRVDQRGVSRRLLGWTLWTWEELESGMVHKRRTVRLSNPHRPLARRSLQLGLMAYNDLQTAMAAINQRYRLPLPPPLPASLTLRLRSRHRVTMDHRGIKATRRGETTECEWPRIQAIIFYRDDPVRRDFASLLVYLPGWSEPLALAVDSSNNKNWKGETPEVVSLFITAHAAAGSVRECMVGGPPAQEDRRVIDRRMAQLLSERRQYNVMALVFALMFVSLAVWTSINNSTASALLLTAPGIVIFLVLHMIVRYTHRTRLTALRAALAEHRS